MLPKKYLIEPAWSLGSNAMLKIFLERLYDALCNSSYFWNKFFSAPFLTLLKVGSVRSHFWQSLLGGQFATEHNIWKGDIFTQIENNMSILIFFVCLFFVSFFFFSFGLSFSQLLKVAWDPCSIKFKESARIVNTDSNNTRNIHDKSFWRPQ